MNSCLVTALTLCGTLLSIFLIIAIALIISLLCKLNRIARGIHRIVVFLNFETRILAPLLLGKKLFAAWIKKTNKHNESDEPNWLFSKIIKGVKWAAAAMLILGIFRNKE